MITFDVSITLTSQQIADMVTTSVEGNRDVRNWCSDFVPKFDTTGLKSPWYDDPSIYQDGLEIEVCVHDPKNTDECFSLVKILKWEDFTAGIQHMAKEFPTSFSDWISDEYDACTGDVFLQCVVYREVVYG